MSMVDDIRRDIEAGKVLDPLEAALIAALARADAAESRERALLASNQQLKGVNECP